MVYFKITVCLLLLSTLVAATAAAEQVDVWFGTTTPRNGLSKGIYHATFDTEQRQTVDARTGNGDQQSRFPGAASRRQRVVRNCQPCG